MNIRLGGNDMNTAWLLDTLGKAKVTGSVKKTILKVSIPKLCADLQSRGESLRYNSKILRGIALMHSLKVDYYMDDMKSYNSRVFRDYSHNNRINSNLDKSNQLVQGGNGIRTGDAKVLSDDPLFNIFLDLIPILELEMENCRKRRRVSIELADANNYADTQIDTFGNSHDKTHFYQLVDDFIDQDVNLSFNDGSQASQVEPQPDFEFNADGGIKLIDKQSANEIEIENENMDIDLGDFDLGNMDQNDQNELNENGVSISRDDNFFISATEDQQSIVVARVRKSRNIKVIEDLTNKFSRTQLNNFATIYENSMEIPLGKVNQQQRIEEVYQEYNQVPPYVNYCQKAIFGKNYQIFMQQYDSRTFTVDNDITTINREIDTIRRVKNMPQSLDFEISRNVQKPQLLQHDGYEVLQGMEQNANENEDDDDALNISFGDIDHSSHINSSQYHYHHPETDGLDDDIPKILDSTQLTKYYNFLLIQNSNIDYDSKTQYRFNLPIEENATNCQFKRLKLTKLIPNNTTEDYPISKKLAARSFSSLLALASKNYIVIEPATKTAPYQLSNLDDIEIIVPVNV